MNPIGKGIVLGAANVVLIAIGMSVMDGEPELGIYVTMFGIIPGLIAGAFLGWLAGCLDTRPVATRSTILAVPAVAVVIVLASQFGMEELILVASIPSVVAALLLERWTRRVEAPPVPVAQIRVD